MEDGRDEVDSDLKLSTMVTMFPGKQRMAMTTSSCRSELWDLRNVAT